VTTQYRIKKSQEIRSGKFVAVSVAAMEKIRRDFAHGDEKQLDVLFPCAGNMEDYYFQYM